ncbi:MAG: DegV family protein [Chloroflexales bacterium]|nr:DegV family protein [Chloroflexales bacterium]
MARIKIVTDSTADIPPQLLAELGIDVVPVLAHIGDQPYRLGIDIPNDQFYEALQEGDVPISTSAPAPVVFEQLYRRLTTEYDHVFSIHLSARLGGIYRAAVQARSKLPASLTRIEVIDSKSASMGLGATVLAAARAARDGVHPEAVAQLINRMIQHTHVIFFVDTIELLEKSGRLSVGAAVLSSMQRTKPLLILDEGDIQAYERTRTRAKAIEGLFTFIEDFPNVQEVIALYATTPEDIDKLLEKVEMIFPRERVQIAQFGPSIAAHLGPGAMGVVVFEGIED